MILICQINYRKDVANLYRNKIQYRLWQTLEYKTSFFGGKAKDSGYTVHLLH